MLTLSCTVLCCAIAVDCSTILAIVFGLGQVGAHFVKDYANNYVVDPLKESVLGAAVEAVPGADQAVDMYTDASNDLVQESHKLKKFQKFFNDTFK